MAERLWLRRYGESIYPIKVINCADGEEERRGGFQGSRKEGKEVSRDIQQGGSGSFSSRCAVNDIPKGDTLFLSPAVSGRLDTIYTNPEKFDPDRFAPGREEDKLKQFSFVGFGGGRHGCMGETFAYLQIKTIWSVLLRKYNMEIVGELPKPDYSAMVVGPTHPCLVKYSRK